MSLGLQTLQRERTPFDLGDGREIYFRTTADFDIPQLGMWNDVRQRMTRIKKRRAKAAGDRAHADLSRQVESAALDVIHLVLPDLPDDILAGLTSGQVDHLAGLCLSVAGGTYQQETDEATQAAVAEKYPDLPEPFLETMTQEQADLLLAVEAEKN